MNLKNKLIGLIVGTIIMLALLVICVIGHNWLGTAFNAMVLVLYLTQIGHTILDMLDNK